MNMDKLGDWAVDGLEEFLLILYDITKAIEWFYLAAILLIILPFSIIGHVYKKIRGKKK